MHVVESSVFARSPNRYTPSSNQVRTLAVHNHSNTLPAILTGPLEFAVGLIANCGHRWLIYGDTDVRMDGLFAHVTFVCFSTTLIPLTLTSEQCITQLGPCFLCALTWNISDAPFSPRGFMGWEPAFRQQYSGPPDPILRMK